VYLPWTQKNNYFLVRRFEHVAR